MEKKTTFEKSEGGRGEQGNQVQLITISWSGATSWMELVHKHKSTSN
jgi:hypothetical protein